MASGTGRGGATVEVAGDGLSAGRASGPVWTLPDGGGGGPGLGLAEARAAAAAGLRELAARAERSPDEAEILAAQAQMLEDPALGARVAELVPTAGAQGAVRQAVETYAAALAALDDPYLAARAADVREIGELWLSQMSDDDLAAAGPPRPSVVVAERLAVAWLLAQPPGRVLAVVARSATRTMHATIVASGLGIPVVAVAAEGDFAACRGARRLLVDGTTGRVALEPPQARGGPGAPAALPGPVRLGGRFRHVSANAADLGEAQAARTADADGIALVRTELAFERAGRLLSAEEQEALYEAVVAAMEGLPVTFRTLDLGADKPLPGVTPAWEANPQLGVRGVRLYRRRPEILEAQLRALWSVASAHPGVGVMFPMVGSPDDWTFCREAAVRARQGATLRGPLAPRLGVMLEVPSALFWLPELVRGGAAFVSIGTNDLLQYLLAQDRERPDLPVPRVPVALLRLLKGALAPLRRAAVPVALCGEAASDPLLAPLLALVGVDEFGVPPARVQAIKRALAGVARRPDWRQVLRPVLESATDGEAEGRLWDLAWWLDD